jgi:glycosyltransferase involved in cell wall biosynthesis
MASVTIGMPVYNGATYLDSALASLCAQTFVDLKILIADNASTDETGDIIKKWSALDKRIEYHRHSQNIGAAANYSWVLNNTNSQWFCFAAHDDLWAPDFIALLHEAIKKKPGLLLAAPRMVTLFEDGREDKSFPFRESVESRHSSTYAIAAFLKFSNSGWYYGLFDRSMLISSFKEVSGFGHTWGHDFVVILPAIFAAAVTGSDKAVYYKRQTPLSDQRYRPKTGKEQFVLYRDTLKISLKLLKASPLSIGGKFFLLPRILKYARKIQKPKRMLRALIRDICARSNTGAFDQ